VKVVVTGGGTGGHLYPAISIGRALREQPGTEVHFAGTREGPEAERAPQEGFPFHAIPSRKLSRQARRPTLGSPEALAALGIMAWGTVRAGLLLRHLRPDVAVGTGGYASAGVMLAAALQGIPTVIHEQNAVAGRANRVLGRLVTRVAITFEGSERFFPAGKAVCTGLPIRPEIAAGDPEPARRRFGLAPDRPTLLVVGGSGGARRLNQAVADARPRLLNLGLQIVHPWGKANVDASVPPAGDGYHPVPYLEEMASALAAADVVLCRAGASTLAEVAAVGRPALLVPYPYAVDDHQTANARVFVDRGAARLVPDRELDGDRLVAELEALLGDPDARARMRAASAALGRPDAAHRVADLVRTVARRRASSADVGQKACTTSNSSKRDVIRR
jgi:UDP-N-acetylglucosamine--N-acetylmuramyl-(pentapeptide) pyrophosphoryl-undecaprenol N-acetylglucosamine transferase